MYNNRHKFQIRLKKKGQLRVFSTCIHPRQDRRTKRADRSLPPLGLSARPCTLRQGAGESESIASTRRKRSRNGARSTFRGVSVTRAAVVWSGEEFRRDAIGGGAAHSVRGWKGG